LATNNAINLKSSGIVTYDAAGTFTASTVTNHGVVTAGASNTVTSVAPSTSGNILTSDGTDWTSAAPVILAKTVTLTSAQIKAIHGTPIEIIPAPGSGKGIAVISAAYKFTYGGTNVFVAGASQSIGLYYNNNTTVLITGPFLVTNASIVGTANAFRPTSVFPTLNSAAAGIYDNVNVAAYNSVATEISGNAANNNTIDIIVYYFIVTF
jgi:hypothetical protein